MTEFPLTAEGISALRFMALAGARPAEFEGTQRTDSAGLPIWMVDVAMTGGRRPGVLAVKVAAQNRPKIEVGPVILKGLSVLYWENNNRSGLSFSADEVVAAK